MLIVVLWAAALAPSVSQAIWMRQEIPLVAGWNAIHVKVNPCDYGCNQVFGGGGIDQVTWWNRDRRDDGTGTVTADTFAWYRSAIEPNTFGAVLGDERYLVHAVAATNLVVFGTPALPRGKIFLGESNLVGLSIPNRADVSCYDYFRYFTGLADSPYWSVSTANVNVLQGAGSAVSDASKAFWLMTVGSGTATYTGPLSVTPDSSEKIVSWSASNAARTIAIKNETSEPRLVRLAFEPSLNPPAGQGTKAGDIKVKVESIDWSQGYARRVYAPLAFPMVTNLEAGATFNLRLRPNLEAMPVSSGDYLGILAISDAGSTIDGEVRSSGTCLYRVGLKAAGGLAGAVQPSGLWVGSVALTGVNRAQMLSSAKSEWDAENVQDAKQPFEFRLVVHAADDGSVKLLKEAFVGSVEDDNATAAILTDRETAKAYRRKYPAAKIRRVSSANFPFMSPQAFEGSVGFLKPGAELSLAFTQAYDAKDNPFRHAFHPNHDNLAFNNGVPSKKEDGATGTGDYESWNVTRQVKLTFAGEDPTGSASEDWNRTVCGGTYRETITGLNKTPIIVEGAFRLYKSLDTPELMSGGVVR